jgi:hypothetical protein
MKARDTVTALLLFCTLCGSAPAAWGRIVVVERWRDLGPRERYHTLQNYWQHQQLPADRQREIEQRYQRWREMSPDERERIRRNYERFRQLPPQERQRFDRKYDKWRQKGAPSH